MAPAFVVGASLTARRFGARIGGLVGGLPVVAGPILLVLAVVHDDAFARRAATTSLLGLISLAGFVLTYGLVCVRRAWPLALLAAWSVFALATAAFALATAAAHIPPTLSLLAACAAFLTASHLLNGVRPRNGPAGNVARPPSWDLPVRAGCAAVMVLAITGLSSAFGSRVSGLLAPAPIITSILAAFTHAQAGAATTLALLRGMLKGFFAFAAFCWTAAVLLTHVAGGVAFVAATLAAVLIQAVSFAGARAAAGR